MPLESYAKHAEIWGLFSGDRTDEVNCWAAMGARYGTTALAAMSATGEIAAALACRGFKVTAVDFTREMIKEGQKRHGDIESLTFVEGDVRFLNLDDREYDFAFFGNTDMNHFLTSPDRQAALMSVGKHTRPGGGLGMELWFPAAESWSSPWRVYEPLGNGPHPLSLPRYGEGVK